MKLISHFFFSQDYYVPIYKCTISVDDSNLKFEYKIVLMEIENICMCVRGWKKIERECTQVCVCVCVMYFQLIHFFERIGVGKTRSSINTFMSDAFSQFSSADKIFRGLCSLVCDAVALGVVVAVLINREIFTYAIAREFKLHMRFLHSLNRIWKVKYV